MSLLKCVVLFLFSIILTSVECTGKFHSPADHKSSAKAKKYSQWKRAKAKGQIPCKFAAFGRCRFGSKCHYSHDSHSLEELRKHRHDIKCKNRKWSKNLSQLEKTMNRKQQFYNVLYEKDVNGRIEEPNLVFVEAFANRRRFQFKKRLSEVNYSDNYVPIFHRFDGLKFTQSLEDYRRNSALYAKKLRHKDAPKFDY